MMDHQEHRNPQPTNTSESTKAPESPRSAHATPATLLQRAQVAPNALSRTDILQLQRTVGNRAVLQLLRATAQMSEASEAEPDEELVDAERPSAEELTLADAEPISVAGDPHTIEYKKVGEEVEIGVSSIWEEIHTIHHDLRRLNLLDPALTHQHNVTKNATKSRKLWESDFNRLDRKIDQKKTEKRKARLDDEDRYETILLELDRLEKELHTVSRRLTIERHTEKAAIHKYIGIAVRINSTVVAEVLGAKMPIVELGTDATGASANTVRYHTGTAGDPIPIIWYKPQASYGAITVDDYSGGLPAAQVVLNPFAANQAVDDQHGNSYTFGVNAANRAGVGTVWPNTPKHGKTRTNQQDYNRVLASLGYDLSAHGEDGDHVRDLGFGGNDVIDNFWPLDSATNRHAFNGWRSTYYINYKKSQTAGRWNIFKAPLNSGSLIGKYFRIKGEENASSPAENNSDQSGSDTTYGAAGIIIERGGTFINEG
ncbi:hypothetical protein CIG75_06480 [Tumebacillus algifaecis]|uniref:Uncharacterized protein n=1 Tax=Tumebacillus algifaecis TaxID=1214604 RepID=A0A223CZ66_9BACL|nr:hypothetical protein [Tumebacillus algifaecis]ASS74650.1 hypothetical protein CIG75_06480 [Tumebacillus algifaecis]